MPRLFSCLEKKLLKAIVFGIVSKTSKQYNLIMYYLYYWGMNQQIWTPDAFVSLIPSLDSHPDQICAQQIPSNEQ